MTTPAQDPKTNVEDLIDYVMSEMSNTAPGTDEFGKMADQLTKLTALKPEKPRVKPETWATIGANLAGIIMVLHYERAHVVASKAIGFVSKLR